MHSAHARCRVCPPSWESEMRIARAKRKLLFCIRIWDMRSVFAKCKTCWPNLIWVCMSLVRDAKFVFVFGACIVLKQNASTLTESCFYYAWYLRKMQNLYRLFIFGVCIICLPGAKRIGWWLPGVRHFKCMLVVSKFMWTLCIVCKYYVVIIQNSPRLCITLSRASDVQYSCLQVIYAAQRNEDMSNIIYHRGMVFIRVQQSCKVLCTYSFMFIYAYAHHNKWQVIRVQ